MNSLRPNSICDTTPLQRLESQSSCSEPSSPTLHTAGSLCMGVTPTTTALIVPISSVKTVNGSLGALGTVCSSNGLNGSNTSSNCSASSGVSSSGSTATTSTTLSLNSQLQQQQQHQQQLQQNQQHLHNNNNSKIEISLNNFINSGVEKHKKMELHGTRKICCRILVDFIVLACVGLPILSFSQWGESYKRGFFCNDDSLMHPYHESTIPSWLLYLMCFIVPISLITIIEFFKSDSHKMHSFGNLATSNYYFFYLEIPDWLLECYKRIGLLIFGSGVCELTTDIAKYSIGRLRPHFFAVCQPIFNDGTTCDNPINEGRYIEEFTCRGLGFPVKVLKDAHLSFPSGHASFTCFTMIYTVIYLHKRWNCTKSQMFKHFLQFSFLMFAWYTSLTRVSDYKHHWTDVLAGSMIGSVYAVIVTSSMW